MSEEIITVYDAYGQEMQVTKDIWREKVLPKQIMETFHNAEALYSTILFAFNDGFCEEIEVASERLIEIDANRERSYSTHGIVLLKLNKKEKAQQIFEEYLKKYGDAPDILSNYAKIFDEKDKQLDILARSLNIDPNQSTALQWYCLIKKETIEDTAYEEALKKWALLDNAWLPQFLLGQINLKHDNFENAYKFFQEVLSKTQNASAILNISGELGNAGKTDELILFIEPVYDSQIHGLPSGFNLLEAYLEKEEYTKGAALLDQLFKLNLPQYKKKLQEYSIKFFEKNKIKDSKKELENPEIFFCTFENPIWYYGLNNPSWLFEELPLKSKKRIGLIPLNKVKNINFGSGKEDNEGKISRSIAYFLEDSLFINTTISPIVIQGFAQGLGPAVYTSRFSKETIQNMVTTDNTSYDLAISGTIDEQETGYEIILDLWNFIEEEKETSFTCFIHKAEKDTALFELRDKIYAYLLDNGYALIYHNQKEDFKTEETEKYCAQYPYILNDLSSFVFINNNYSKADGLYFERSIYDRFFELVSNHPNLLIPKIMAICAYINGKSYQSSVIDEFTPLIELILKSGYIVHQLVGRDAQNPSKTKVVEYPIPALESPIYRLSPIVLIKIGKIDEAREVIKTLKEKGNCPKQYFEWAAKLLKPFEPEIPTTNALPEPTQASSEKEKSEKDIPMSLMKKLKHFLQKIIIP